VLAIELVRRETTSHLLGGVPDWASEASRAASISHLLGGEALYAEVASANHLAAKNGHSRRVADFLLLQTTYSVESMPLTQANAYAILQATYSAGAWQQAAEPLSNKDSIEKLRPVTMFSSF
jgi:hypothetical protein